MAKWHHVTNSNSVGPGGALAFDFFFSFLFLKVKSHCVSSILKPSLVLKLRILGLLTCCYYRHTQPQSDPQDFLFFDV